MELLRVILSGAVAFENLGSRRSSELRHELIEYRWKVSLLLVKESVDEPGLAHDKYGAVALATYSRDRAHVHHIEAHIKWIRPGCGGGSIGTSTVGMLTDLTLDLVLLEARRYAASA